MYDYANENGSKTIIHQIFVIHLEMASDFYRVCLYSQLAITSVRPLGATPEVLKPLNHFRNFLSLQWI